MEKKILLSCLTFLMLTFGFNSAQAQTDCVLQCPVGSFAVSTTSEDDYTVPNFYENGVVNTTSNCAEGEFTQSPAEGTILEVGEYEVITTLDFDGDTTSCSFLLVVNDGNTGGGKCVVVCPEYLYVTPDSSGNYILPDFFLNEIIFLGGCEPTDKSQEPAQGTVFSGDTLPVFLNYTIDRVVGSCSFYLLMDETTGIEAISDESEMTMYPNPAHHEVNIRSQEALKRISIYDITGKRVLTTKAPTIDVSILNKGMYFVEIETAVGTAMKRLVVE